MASKMNTIFIALLFTIELCLPVVYGIKHVIDNWDDQYAECAAWADNFQCEKNPKFMLRKCIESCYMHDTVHAAVLSGKPSIITCESSVGPFVLELHPDWAPWGVNRFLKLVSDGFFNGSPLNRSHYFINFGNTPDLNLLSKWSSIPPIPDDLSHLKPFGDTGFKHGMVSFSSKPSDGRSTNLFIVLADDQNLGKNSWESPIGQVIVGLSNLRATKNIASYKNNDVPVIISCKAELPEEEKTAVAADMATVQAITSSNLPHSISAKLPVTSTSVRTTPIVTDAAKLAAQERIDRRKRIRRAERLKERTKGNQ